MHEAYIYYPPATISVQIDSIAAYGNKVLLGTRQGHLLVYGIHQNEQDDKLELQLLQYDKNFAKRPVVQIEVVAEDNLLFSLSDGIINVHDISKLNFPLLHSATKTKGANIFCLDVQHSKSLTGETAIVLRMCVAIKRKLQFYYWKHDNLLEFRQSFDVSDIPKALSWSQNVICIGFKTEYVLYDISAEPKKKDLFPTSSSRTLEPCICRVNDMFALVKDQFVVAIDPSIATEASNKTQVETLQKKSDDDDLLAGERKTPFKHIIWTDPARVLAWDEPYICGLVADGMEVRSLHTTKGDSLLQTIPELAKARLLVRSGKDFLFAASYSQLWYIQSVEISKQRQSLLQQKNFQLALQLTRISNESEMEKTEITHQIQTRYAFDLFANKEFSKAMQVFAKLKTDTCDVIRLFPDLLPHDSQQGGSQTNVSAQPMDEMDLENGLLALIDYLTEVRFNIKMELRQNSSVGTKIFGKKTPLLSIIDTTLLKCYLQTNDSFVAPLLRLNHCHLEESEKTLRKYQKFGELIILYQTKGQHKLALELLQSQAKISGSSLQGHDRTVQYLQHLGKEYKNLIFEFSDWVLKEHAEDGLKIFIEDMPEVENLPRAEVLDFLLKNHKGLVIPYLEHVIHVWNEPKPIFHNIKIQQYREKIQTLMSEIKDEQGLEGQKKITLENLRSKLTEFLKKSERYNPETVLSDFPCNDLFDERAIILGRLGKHEKALAIYIQILGDVSKACSYAEDVYDDYKDIFAVLVKTILTPPSAPPYSSVELHPSCLKPNTDIVLDILDKYTIKVNPTIVLPHLPDDIPLIRLQGYLEAVLRNQLEQKRQNQVLKGLLHAEHLQVQEQQMHYETKSFAITDFTTCPVCKKRFTNQSAFVRYPDGEIVHYSCH